MSYLYTAVLFAIVAVAAITGITNQNHHSDIPLFLTCCVGAAFGIGLHMYFRHRRSNP
jgi:hypothetical protein